jgi:hypothetical protein
MTKQRADWWRYSNIVPIIFTFLTIVVVLSGFFFTMSAKLDYVAQRLDKIDSAYQQLLSNDQQQKLEIQHIEDATGLMSKAQ